MTQNMAKRQYRAAEKNVQSRSLRRSCIDEEHADTAIVATDAASSRSSAMR